MPRVGLTGGIACGKSLVAAMFSHLGASVLQADQLAHQLYRPGQPIYEEILRQFGREMVQPNGEIDRARLAAAAFGGGRVEELNQIVHPEVIRLQEEWLREIESRDPHAITMVEAALIFEAKMQDRFDKIIAVSCSPEQKVTRFAVRSGMDENAARVEVERRMNAQIPDEEKARRADFVIDNSGSREDTRRQVERIFEELK